MKYYIYSNELGFEFEEEVDSLEFSDIEDFVNEFFSDEIEDAIHSTTLSEKSQGFFPDTREIETELFNEVRMLLEQRFGGKIFGKELDDNGVIASNQAIDAFSELINDREEREQGIVDTGALVIAMLTNFLNEGIWQYGLQRDDGTILTDISQCPKHTTDGTDVIWQDSDGLLEPIIWFGLKNEDPIECWTLDKSPEKFELLKLYDNPYATETRLVERWHNFWFCTFWNLDWNALFDNNGNTHITWMFAECGMDEPVEEFNAVRDSCPIQLDENDTYENIIRKIEQLLIDKQRAIGENEGICSN
jgi:hypothetical protein